MKPIGLTCKHTEEIMIVHVCLHCGKISCNRIAGDDDPHIILSLIDTPNSLDQHILTSVARHGLTLATALDTEKVLICLYGYNYKQYR